MHIKYDKKITHKGHLYYYVNKKNPPFQNSIQTITPYILNINYHPNSLHHPRVIKTVTLMTHYLINYYWYKSLRRIIFTWIIPIHISFLQVLNLYFMTTSLSYLSDRPARGKIPQSYQKIFSGKVLRMYLCLYFTLDQTSFLISEISIRIWNQFF